MKAKSNVRFFLRIKTYLLLVSLATLFSSCLNDDDMPAPTPVAYVAMFHGAANGPALDILASNRRINNMPFEYTDYIGYRQFFPGNREIKFNASNASNSLIDTTIRFEADNAYSVFVHTVDSELNLLVLRDSAEAPPAGTAMMRLVHLSPDAPAVNLRDGDNMLVEGHAFREGSEYQRIAAKTHNFVLQNAENEEQLLRVSGHEIKEGQYYTFIIRGFANPAQGNVEGLNMQIIRQ